MNYACNACTWKGPLKDTVMLGSVGPLCPDCRETTEPYEDPRRGMEYRHRDTGRRTIVCDDGEGFANKHKLWELVGPVYGVAVHEALGLAVQLMAELPTLNGLTGLAVYEHCKRLHELSPITGEPLPINMVLHCPNCGLQHIDKADRDSHAPCKTCAAVPAAPCFDWCTAWADPPHKTHLCAACRWQWRVADVPTRGVAALQTAGEADSQGTPRLAARAAYKAQPGFFALPPSHPSDLWAVGVGSTKADNCFFAASLDAAIDRALKWNT